MFGDSLRNVTRILQPTALGIALSFSFTAFKSGAEELGRNEVGCLARESLLSLVGGNTSRFLCRQFDSCRLLDLNYPLARHRDRTYIAIEYALHSCFIPSDVAMSPYETSQQRLRAPEKQMFQPASRCYRA